MKRSIALLSLLGLMFFCSACGGSGNPGPDEDPTPVSDEDSSRSDGDETDDEDYDDIPAGSIFGAPRLNPSGNIPLSATISMKAEGVARVSVAVKDIDPDKSDFVREYETGEDAENYEIPILGLFAGTKNEVVLKAYDAEGEEIEERLVKIKTAELPKDFPKITMSGKIESGWTLVNWLRTPRSRTAMNGIAVDEYGRVRWFTDLFSPVCFPIVISGDTFYCGGGENETHIDHYDFMGYPLDTVDVSPLGYKKVHHEVTFTSDGNYLVGVDKAGSDYIEDHIIEINASDGSLRGSWNLNDTFPDVADLFMDMMMTSPEIPGQTNNPIHHNAIFYDPSDDTLIVSSQTAGIAKITHKKYLKWYLAPHLFGLIDDADKDGKSDSFTEKYDPDNMLTWVGDYYQTVDGKTTAGEKYVNERAPINGIPYEVYSPFEFRYAEFFLTPLDKNGNEITDIDVVNGFASTDDFAWPFRGHNPTILKNGNLMMFDNGLARNFGFPPISQNHYSRVVEYKIVPDKDGYGGTIQQIWEYKLESDPMWYAMSLIVSSALELENGNRLITSGSIGSSFIPEMFRSQYADGPVGAFVVEVDPADNSEKNRLTFDRYIDDEFPVNEFSIYRSYRFQISARVRK